MTEQEKKAEKVDEKENRSYIIRTIQKATENISDGVENYNEKYIKNNVKKGRELIDEFRKEPVQFIQTRIENGYKRVKEIPVIEKLNKKVTDAINIPAMMNLPTKSEVDELFVALDLLSNRVDSLQESESV